MAFFKFPFPRSKAGARAVAPEPAESIEVIRRRARHRLIGASVLVSLVVTVFPMVFDTQPRPIAVDVPILIPDRAKAEPLAVPAVAEVASAAAVPAPAPPPASEPAPVEIRLPASAVVPAQTASAVVQRAAPLVSAPAPAVAVPRVVPVNRPVSHLAAASAAAPVRVAASAARHEAVATKPVVAPAALPAPKADRSQELTKAEPKPATKPELVKPEAKSKPEAKTEARPAQDDGHRARDLLDGRDGGAAASATTPATRFLIQAGAYADADKVRELRHKIEKAGLPTYTQVVETKDGEKRTRVRVGPFTNKAEADKAASRLRALDLPAAVLSF
jgi:DedD protein